MASQCGWDVNLDLQKTIPVYLICQLALAFWAHMSQPIYLPSLSVDWLSFFVVSTSHRVSFLTFCPCILNVPAKLFPSLWQNCLTKSPRNPFLTLGFCQWQEPQLLPTFPDTGSDQTRSIQRPFLNAELSTKDPSLLHLRLFPQTVLLQPSLWSLDSFEKIVLRSRAVFCPFECPADDRPSASFLQLHSFTIPLPGQVFTLLSFALL